MEYQIFQNNKLSTLINWKVKVGGYIKKGHVIMEYFENDEPTKILKYKSTSSGVINQLIVQKGQTINTGSELMKLEDCTHSTWMSDLCTVCGIDFRQFENAKPLGTSVSMIHTVPDLKCSIKEAQEISKIEEIRLLKQKKLHLLVDLDQTLIHTTNMDVPPFVNDVFHFHVQGSPLMYHTRLRPGTRKFLKSIANLYELHICTFGSRHYAHSIARYLDPDGTLFYIRILSRDECFNQNSKTANLQDLFPSGDHMVCIIDDREDVWNFTPNLIHVKPYHFFSKTGDINAPPSLTKKEDDNKIGFDFTGGSVKQLAPLKVSPNKESKTEDTNSTNSTGEAKNDLSKDLLLTDESDTSSDKDLDSDSSSSSSNATEASTPKPDVPHVFDDEESRSNDTITNVAKSALEEFSSEKNEGTESKSEGFDDQPSPSKEKSLEKKAELKRKEDHEEKTLTEDEKQYLLPDADDYLLYLEDILNRIHKAFYSEYERRQTEGDLKLPNVKEIIPAIKKNILKGCSIVFSGIIPVGSKLQMSRAYGVAVSLGAIVTETFNPPRRASQPSSSKDFHPTTHVVAARMGTAKTNEARRYKGVHIVTPDWLWCCAERWDHVDEKLFALGKRSTVRRHPPSHIASERDSEASIPDPSVDDDAFLAEERVQPEIAPVENGGIRPPGVRRVRTLSGRFMDTINPLMSFSIDEIADMDHEVDDICGLSGSSSSDEDTLIDGPKRRERIKRKKETKSVNAIIENRISESSSQDSSDDEDSTSFDIPCKRKRDIPSPEEEPEEEESLIAKFRRGESLPSDVELLNLTNQTSDDENDCLDQENEWMARQLEAELLGGDSSQDLL